LFTPLNLLLLLFNWGARYVFLTHVNLPAIGFASGEPGGWYLKIKAYHFYI